MDTIDTIEEATRELSEVEQCVLMDAGEDAVEAGWSDLVHTVAERCTDDVAQELLRRNGLEVRSV